MIKVKFKRPPGFKNLPKKYEREMTKALTTEMTLGLSIILDSIEETPVYTGRTLVNYRFSLGAPVDDVRPAVKIPALPGKTSEMQIGKEPRRSANWAVVLAEYETTRQGILSNPFQKLYLTNNAPSFLDVEYGTYKVADGQTQRTPPGGMVRRAESQISARVRK